MKNNQTLTLRTRNEITKGTIIQTFSIK